MFLIYTYPSQTGILNLNQTRIYYFVLESGKLHWLGKVSLRPIFCLLMFFIFAGGLICRVWSFVTDFETNNSIFSKCQ